MAGYEDGLERRVVELAVDVPCVLRVGDELGLADRLGELAESAAQGTCRRSQRGLGTSERQPGTGTRPSDWGRQCTTTGHKDETETETKTETEKQKQKQKQKQN